MHAKQPTIPVLYDKKDCGGKEQYEIAWIKGVSVMIFFNNFDKLVYLYFAIV